MKRYFTQFSYSLSQMCCINIMGQNSFFFLQYLFKDVTFLKHSRYQSCFHDYGYHVPELEYKTPPKIVSEIIFFFCFFGFLA